jgi:hypothetical protein
MQIFPCMGKDKSFWRAKGQKVRKKRDKKCEIRKK